MSMEVRKESNGLKNSMVTREELAIINQFTKRALKEDEVYTFAVRLCDNEVDRDGERFPRATLEELAELFVGKSGIFDHEWTTKGQAARIYRTEIVEEEGVCSQGEGRCYLKGYAYMLRGEVKRLMLVCEQEADGEAVEKLAEKLDESELKEMEKLYRGKMAKKLGLRTQLTYGEKTKAAEDESDFRV